MSSQALGPDVTFSFENVPSGKITEEMLKEAAELFSRAYGVWGLSAAQMHGSRAKQGIAFIRTFLPLV